ncbi:MAG: hypothetical protein VXW87_00730 [Pseudomonadota bacterium]|nr:hypothetical protein [Pseudomonadota bacterium]
MEELKESLDNYTIGPNELLCCYEQDYQDISTTLNPERLSNISSLKLSDIEFDDECMVQLANCLSTASCHPSCLDLSNNLIGVKGAEIIFNLINCPNNQISTLNLYHNHLGDGGTYWISFGLQALINLNLAHNQISDAGVHYLCDKIKTSPLSFLSLAYNSISSSGASELIFTAKSLESLSLISNLVDKRIILRIKQRVMNLTAPWPLRILSLSGNYINSALKEWRALKKTISLSPLCSLALEEYLRSKSGKPILPTQRPKPIYRLSETFLTYAVNIEQSKLEMHSPFEQVVLLTLLNTPAFAKDTLTQLHKVMSCGSQYKNFYNPPTLIPYEIEDLIASKHFHVYFWEKKVKEMPTSHPYLISLQTTIPMLNNIQSQIGFNKACHIRFFNRLNRHVGCMLRTIEL